MADVDTVQDALLEAIESLAKSAINPTGATQTTATAGAAKDFAEAYAWLQSPATGHSTSVR